MRSKSPSDKFIMPNLAPQSLVAFAKMVSNTGFRSLGEREMTRNISEVADSCSSASSRSRFSCSNCFGEGSADADAILALRGLGLLFAVRLAARFHRVAACHPLWRVHGDAQFYVSSDGQAMSALGQKQTCAPHSPMSALPPI